jgi:glycine cleavage system H protein
MSEIPGDLKFLKSHEWARVEGNGRVTVGISDHAQGLLGDLVYVELPEVGADAKAGEQIAVVESVKAASDVYSPISGKVVEVNSALSDKPETINEDAYGEGWMFVVELTNAEEVNELLDRTRTPKPWRTTTTESSFPGSGTATFGWPFLFWRVRRTHDAGFAARPRRGISRQTNGADGRAQFCANPRFRPAPTRPNVKTFRPRCGAVVLALAAVR